MYFVKKLEGHLSNIFNNNLLDVAFDIWARKISRVWKRLDTLSSISAE